MKWILILTILGYWNDQGSSMATIENLSFEECHKIGRTWEEAVTERLIKLRKANDKPFYLCQSVSR